MRISIEEIIKPAERTQEFPVITHFDSTTPEPPPPPHQPPPLPPYTPPAASENYTPHNAASSFSPQQIMQTREGREIINRLRNLCCNRRILNAGCHGIND